MWRVRWPDAYCIALASEHATIVPNKHYCRKSLVGSFWLLISDF